MQNNIGEARRKYAAKVGRFTQNNAAEYFGVSLSTYKKWEQGSGKLNGERLRQIANKYGVSVDFLLGTSAYSKSDDAKKKNVHPAIISRVDA